MWTVRPERKGTRRLYQVQAALRTYDQITLRQVSKGEGQRGRDTHGESEREQEERLEELSKFMTRLLRYDHPKKIWYTQGELVTE